MAAARAGCSVLALDASDVAISHLRQLAIAEGLPVEAQVADLSQYDVTGHFDSIVSIGLLMFLDCVTAQRALADLQVHLVPGGTMVVERAGGGNDLHGHVRPQRPLLVSAEFPVSAIFLLAGDRLRAPGFFSPGGHGEVGRDHRCAQALRIWRKGPGFVPFP